MTDFKDVNKIKVAKHCSVWWAGVKVVIKMRGPHTERDVRSF
jgi:hypothetical protein